MDTLSINLVDALSSLGPGEFLVETFATEFLIARALASGLFGDAGRIDPRMGITDRATIWRIRHPLRRRRTLRVAPEAKALMRNTVGDRRIPSGTVRTKTKSASDACVLWPEAGTRISIHSPRYA